MKKSPVPKPRPRSRLAPKKSPIPMSRDEGLAGLTLKRFIGGATSREGEDMKTFGKFDKKSKPKKMAKGGMCRGMGAASKGGKYKA